MSRTLRISAATAVLLGFAALPASAHVTVSADDTSRGADDSVLTFRVPNEIDTSTVTKLEVRFPTSTPLAEVDPEPKPGWTITTKTVTFAKPIVTDDGTTTSGVGDVVWTADPGSPIPAGDFGAFRVLVGPLPDVPQLVFPALQTYANGQTISWIDPTTDPANPPKYPAAILALTANSEAPPPSAKPTVTANYATKSAANTGKTLGILGIVVGALGLLVGAAALTRRRDNN